MNVAAEGAEGILSGEVVGGDPGAGNQFLLADTATFEVLLQQKKKLPRYNSRLWKGFIAPVRSVYSALSGLDMMSAVHCQDTLDLLEKRATHQCARSSRS